MKVLVLCGDKIYTKAIARQVEILLHQRMMSSRTSWASITESNMNLINEEVGEMSLSILQRALLRSSFKRDIRTVSRKYANVSAVVNDMTPQIAAVSTRFANDRNHRRTLNMDAKDCEKMKEFLDLKVVEIQGDHLNIYGSIKGYESKAKGTVSRAVDPVVKRKFGKAWIHLKQLMNAEQRAWGKYMTARELESAIVVECELFDEGDSSSVVSGT